MIGKMINRNTELKNRMVWIIKILLISLKKYIKKKYTFKKIIFLLEA